MGLSLSRGRVRLNSGRPCRPLSAPSALTILALKAHQPDVRLNHPDAEADPEVIPGHANPPQRIGGDREDLARLPGMAVEKLDFVKILKQEPAVVAKPDRTCPVIRHPVDPLRVERVDPYGLGKVSIPLSDGDLEAVWRP